MPQGHCEICLNYFPVSEFLVLPCGEHTVARITNFELRQILLQGHGCCKNCHKHRAINANNVSCWMCRREFPADSAHRIHLDLVDSKVAILATTIEGLGKMDAAAKVISVNNASERIQRTAKEIECDNERAVRKITRSF